MMNDARFSFCVRFGLILFLAFALSGANVHASGFRNPPEGASSLGRAGGRIAFADDASAISANPANLADLKEKQIMVSLTAAHSETDYKGASGSGSTREPWKLLPNAFLAWPTKHEGVVAGLGVTTPFGQSMEWEQDGPFRYTAPYFVEMRLVDFRPAVAFPLGEHFTFGVAADVMWSDLDFRQVYPWSVLAGNPAVPDGEVRLTGEGQGLGGSAALAWKITSRQRLALTYRSPFNVDYSGDTELKGQPAAAGLPGRSDFDTTIRYPAVWGLGYGIELTDKIRLGADVEWVEFSRYDRLDLDAGALSRLLPAETIRQDWKDVWTLGVGMDWKLTECTVLRAGYTFLESPIPDETLAPTLPDADRHAVSFGVGFRKARHALDLAYVWSHYDDRDVRANQNPAYVGRYENEASMLALSYGCFF